MAKLTLQQYLDVVIKSKLVDKAQLAQIVTKYRSQSSAPMDDCVPFAKLLVQAKLITPWQNQKLLDAKSKGFFIGKYKLLSHIGTGGMSSVYLAEHTVMRRRVALKVLPAHLVEDDNYLRRFYKESQATAALDHPNIVRAYDVDNEGKIHYLVMEFVEGSDLEQAVKKQGPLPYDKAADYIRQAADGLAHAHARRMIHRDIKPSNLLVDLHGTVKILDMGLAHLEDADNASQVQNQNVMGTTDFLAPEQAMGSKTLDSRADIYSLGCTLYYLLAGKAPFAGATLAEVLLKHQTRDPQSVSEFREDCPPALEAIYLKMMAKDPNERYQNCDEVSTALTRWLTHGDDLAHSATHIRSAEEAEELSDFLRQLDNDREEREHEPEPKPKKEKKKKPAEGEQGEDLDSFLGSLSEAEVPSPEESDEEMQSFFSSLGSAGNTSKSSESSTELFLFDGKVQHGNVPPSKQPPKGAKGGSAKGGADSGAGALPPRSVPPKNPRSAGASGSSSGSSLGKLPALPAGKVETAIPPAQSQTPTPSKKAENMEFVCPNGHRLFGPTKLQGRRGQCPHCKAYFRIPFLDGSEGGSEGASGSTISGPAKSQSPAPSKPAPNKPASGKPASNKPSPAKPDFLEAGPPPDTGDDNLDQFLSNLERD